MSEPLVSIIIPAIRPVSWLRRCLCTIKDYTHISYEVVVVCAPQYAQEIEALSSEHPLVVIPDTAMSGWTHASNVGFRAAKGKYLCWLSDDCEATPRWIENAIDFIGERDIMVALYFVDPNYDRPVVNKVFGHLYANFGVLKNSLAERVGYFDEEHFTHYASDPDFALKLYAAGYGVEAIPDAQIIHHYVLDDVRREDLRAPAAEILKEKWKGIFTE